MLWLGCSVLQLDLDPRTAVVSLDGRSAYDCVSRSAIFTALHTTAPALVPFVRAIYGTPSIFHWWDDQGAHHVITQGEGVEQGGPLSPRAVRAWTAPCPRSCCCPAPA